jgi:chemotaxis protein MotB
MIGAQDGDQDTRQHELVIIKRRAGGEEAPHKGGVWKIAHADFMTALMAFFLVMWLITATDEKTITGVANYFNPIRLTDSTARPKGIFSNDPEKQKDGGAEGGKHGEPKTSKATEANKKAEAAMFGAPYEVLDKLAAEAGKATPNLHLTERGNMLAHNTGEAFRDPFDPDSRYEPLRHAETDHAPTEKSADPNVSTPPPAAAQAEPQPNSKPDDKSEAKPAAAVPSSDLKEPIEQAVRDSGFSPIPGIDVRATGEGVLISISDQPDFEMFGIASAKPKPEVVVLLDKIGKIIQSRPESIVIRGHTDGRPYRAGDYDNWRLSTARAQMAYYMLMRSGIPEGRVSRIEGHADHDLQDVNNPLAAENRRIEILLAKDKS